MAPSDRLKPVRRIAENRERNAAKLFGDAQRLLKDQESKLEQLHLFQQEYRERFEAAARGGMSANQLQEYQAFMLKLQKAVEQQTQRVEVSRRESDEKKQTWQQKHTRTEAIGKAIERFRRDERKVAEKKEQQENDEYSLRGSRNSS